MSGSSQERLALAWEAALSCTEQAPSADCQAEVLKAKIEYSNCSETCFYLNWLEPGRVLDLDLRCQKRAFWPNGVEIWTQVSGPESQLHCGPSEWSPLSLPGGVPFAANEFSFPADTDLLEGRSLELQGLWSTFLFDGILSFFLAFRSSATMLGQVSVQNLRNFLLNRRRKLCFKPLEVNFVRVFLPRIVNEKKNGISHFY